MSSEADYGIHDDSIRRDEDGNLLPEDHEFEYLDQTQKIAIHPLTMAEQKEFEDKYANREDLEYEEMVEILDQRLAQPKIDDWDDLHPKEFVGFVKGVLDYLTGDSSDEFLDEVEDEIEARQDEGN